MSDLGPGPENDEAPSPDAIRRRRRWLLAFSALALTAIVSVVVVQLFAGDEQERKRERALDDTARAVVLERFDMLPRRGKSRRGLAEFVRREGKTYLRLIAGGLRQNFGDEVYQASLVRSGDERLLGSQTVGKKGVFVGQTGMTSELLHSYRTIELRLVGSGESETGRLILRGKIPN